MSDLEPHGPLVFSLFFEISANKRIPSHLLYDFLFVAKLVEKTELIFVRRSILSVNLFVLFDA